MRDPFEHALALHTRNWARVNRLLRVARLGLPDAQRILKEETDSYVEMSIADDHHATFTEYLEKVGTDAYVQGQLDDSQSAVDAAAVIFMHSILDDTAMTCCKMFAGAKPQECEYWVDEKKVGLRELREEGYDSLLKRAIEKRLAKLEHESLLVKADLLMRLCSLPKEFVSLTKNYVYDRDTLVRLDDERHKLVHGGRWAGLFRRNDEDLEYLYDTGLYFLDVVSFRCHPQDVRTRGREAP